MEYKEMSFGGTLGNILNLYIRNIKRILAGGIITLAVTGILFWIILKAGIYLGISGNLLEDFFGNYNRSLTENASYLLKGIVFFTGTAYSIFLLWGYHSDFEDSDLKINGISAFSMIKSSYLPLLLCNVLVFLGTIGGTALLVVPGIIFSLAWFVSDCYVVFEEKKAVEAMRSSWRITKDNRLNILGLSIVVTLISGLVMFLLSTIIKLGLDFLQVKMNLPWTLYQWNEILLNLFISTPIQASMVLVLYRNLKMKKEGLPENQLEKEFNKEEASAEV